MKFSSNNIARKNGLRFEIKYSQWLDGERAENPWYIYCARYEDDHSISVGTYTERSFRFPNEEEAKIFCEKVANGEVTLEQLMVAEKKEWDEHYAKVRADSVAKVDAFFDKMEELGINPILFPEIVQAYLGMGLAHDPNASAYFNQRIEELKNSPDKEAVKKMTLAEHLNVYQNDIDVCLVDKDTGEHYLPCICYLDEEEQADLEYGYDDWEKWVLSLPLSHISDWNGCPLAVVETEFNWDQTCFLIGQNEIESTDWADIYHRSVWAGAEFQDRLEYLTTGKSFEHPFDGTCMDALHPEDQMKLCEMLADHNEVFITTYPDKEDEYYVYSYHLHKVSHRPVYDSVEVDIKLTEPGQGLTSTLQGKVYWAQHVGNKAKAEALKQTAPAKKNEKEL